MANQNYDQVAELLSQGNLNWAVDPIVAFLISDGSFDASQKTYNDLTGDRRATAPINGRYLGPEGAAMGQPVTFQKVGAGEYQVVLAQDVGNNNPNLLAFIDTNAEDAPITVAATGTLIVRPVEPDGGVPPEQSPTIGVWMRL